MKQLLLTYRVVVEQVLLLFDVDDQFFVDQHLTDLLSYQEIVRVFQVKNPSGQGFLHVESFDSLAFELHCAVHEVPFQLQNGNDGFLLSLPELLPFSLQPLLCEHALQFLQLFG